MLVGVKIKIIIGAGNTSYTGWVSTQENELYLLNRAGFEKQFKEESVDAMLAEHVWEHMTEQEGIQAAKNCYAFLKAVDIFDVPFLIKIFVMNGIKIWCKSVVQVQQTIQHIHTKSYMIIKL